MKNNICFKEKEAFRLIGYSTELGEDGKINDRSYSQTKTDFFKSIIQEGKMAALKPLSTSHYGFGSVYQEGEVVFYLAGVMSNHDAGPEMTKIIDFKAGKYLVISGSGGLSRLAFDGLEQQIFDEVLPARNDIAYGGGPIAEVLLNGNPMECEVECWIPIKEK